jgi:Flp pilus assembly protein TadD
MTEPTQLAEYEVDYAELDTEDLGTGYLEHGTEPKALNAQTTPETAEELPSVETDWLALLKTHPDMTALFPDEAPVEPEPSGMSGHIAPPRMRPTFGAKVSTGLKKGFLLGALLVISVGGLLGGAYALYSSNWLQTAVPASLVPAQVRQETAQQAAPAAPVPAQASNNAGSDPGSTTGSAGEAVMPPAIQGGSAAVEQMRAQGESALKAGKYADAITSLEGALNAGSGDAVTFYQLGLAYLGVSGRSHSNEDAEMAFRSASALQPSWAAPKQMLAESLIRRGLYQEAIDPAQQAVNLDGTKAEAYMTLGRAYRGAGDNVRATDAFAQALRLAPAPPDKP